MQVLAAAALVTTATSAPAAALCNLNGNWTNRVNQKPGEKDVVHIEFFQSARSTTFTLRATPWGDSGSSGKVISPTQVSLAMVGASGPQTLTISAAAAPGAPPCTQLSSGWCKFPFCGFPEPQWPPWPATRPPTPAPAPIVKSCAASHNARPCPPPPWPPVYQMNRSTVVQPCNSSGYWSNPDEFGLTSFDWSNAKAIWSSNTNNATNCSEMLVEQAKMVKTASHGRTRVFVYRNFELALEWIRGQRAAMNDPTKSGYFLYVSLSSLFHVTPVFVSSLITTSLTSSSSPLSSQYQDEHGVSTGKVYSEPQLNGLRQYFWNFSNPEAVDFFIADALGKDAIGNAFVDGIFSDDVAGTFQEHGNAVRNMNLSAAQVHEIETDSNKAYDTIIAALVAAGGYNWQAFGAEDATGAAIISGKATCAAKMRAACGAQHAAKWAATPRLVGAVHDDQGIASFLIARGPFWWSGSGWGGCSDAVQEHSPSNLDPGTPTGLCEEYPGNFFTRKFTKGRATLDCNSYTATLDFTYE